MCVCATTVCDWGEGGGVTQRLTPGWVERNRLIAARPDPLAFIWCLLISRRSSCKTKEQLMSAANWKGRWKPFMVGESWGLQGGPKKEMTTEIRGLNRSFNKFAALIAAELACLRGRGSSPPFDASHTYLCCKLLPFRSVCSWGGKSVSEIPR